MTFFPQLSTGALAQFPMSKRVLRRTILNTLPDRSTVKLSDSGMAVVEWDLQYSGLSDEEASALEQLFVKSEGELRTFVFLDPTGNLLAWSESFGEDAWVKDPLLTMEDGRPDPTGGTNAFLLQNTTGAAQSMRQTVRAPARYQYCVSAWLRTTAQGQAVMRIASERRACWAGSEWARISMVGFPGGDEETVTFGLEVQPGQALEVFGFQAEAQPGASGYQRTGSSGGVYPLARFGGADLRITAEAPNAHACRVRVVSNANSL
jgi:hypothetical protein